MALERIDFGFGEVMECSYEAAQAERQERWAMHQDMEECRKKRESKLYDKLSDIKGMGRAFMEKRQVKRVL